MERAEILKIADSVAEEIIKRYKPPKSIEHGLAESMGEEQAAFTYYTNRAIDALAQNDVDTAILYNHISLEEAQHSNEFKRRLDEIAGIPVMQNKPIKVYAIDVQKGEYELVTENPNRRIKAKLKFTPDTYFTKLSKIKSGFTTENNPNRYIIPIDEGLYWLPEDSPEGYPQGSGYCSTITNYEMIEFQSASPKAQAVR